MSIFNEEFINYKDSDFDTIREVYHNFEDGIKTPNFLYEILKMDWRFIEWHLSNFIDIIAKACPEQFDYVDENGNNILMTYCEHVDGLDKECVKDDLDIILRMIPHSIYDINYDLKDCLDLAKDKLGPKYFNIANYLQPFFKK